MEELNLLLAQLTPWLLGRHVITWLFRHCHQWVKISTVPELRFTAGGASSLTHSTRWLRLKLSIANMLSVVQLHLLLTRLTTDSCRLSQWVLKLIFVSQWRLEQPDKPAPPYQTSPPPHPRPKLYIRHYTRDHAVLWTDSFQVWTPRWPEADHIWRLGRELYNVTVTSELFVVFGSCACSLPWLRQST